MSRALAALLPGIFVALALDSSPSTAQLPGGNVEPTFEVASVKLNESGGRERFNRILPGGHCPRSTCRSPISSVLRTASRLAWTFS
jgi:hypothetical protein